MRYSVQPRDQIFVKGYGFLALLKIWAKILGKIKEKTWVVNTVKDFLIMLKNVLIELRKFQEIYKKLTQKQSQMSMIKKYLQKDI